MSLALSEESEVFRKINYQGTQIAIENNVRLLIHDFSITNSSFRFLQQRNLEY